GTTFKIYLPRVNQNEEALEPGPGPEKSLQGSETILLVEDEEFVRKMIRSILERNGYRVLEANDASTALKVSADHEGPIHLLLTDVVMPKMSGRELAEKLLQSRPEAKLIFMSGYTEHAILHQAAIQRGAEILQKPFSPHALARKIRDILG